jgi:hypothetical protein
MSSTSYTRQLRHVRGIWAGSVFSNLFAPYAKNTFQNFWTKISRMWHSSIKAARMEKQKCSYIHVVHSGHMLTSHQNVYKLFEVVIMCELLFRSNARAFN